MQLKCSRTDAIRPQKSKKAGLAHVELPVRTLAWMCLESDDRNLVTCKSRRGRAI